jgi:hypothetical protein
LRALLSHFSCHISFPRENELVSHCHGSFSVS